MPIMMREGKKVSRGNGTSYGRYSDRESATGAVLAAKNLSPSEVRRKSGETRTRCWRAMDVAVLVIPMSSPAPCCLSDRRWRKR